MFKTFFVLAFLMNLTIEACADGCLKCDTQATKCLVCDSQNNYHFNATNDSCDKNTDANCIASTNLKECLGCKGKFYPNPASLLACVALPEADVIPMCLVYDKSKNCLLCQDDFYPSTKSCLVSTNKVENCYAYYDNGKCKACNNGYRVDFDGAVCVIDED